MECSVCKKSLQEKEGLVSDTGVIVCGEACRKAFMEKQGNGALEVYSRVTGYYTPVKSWNKGKLKEFRERNRYELQR